MRRLITRLLYTCLALLVCLAALAFSVQARPDESSLLFPVVENEKWGYIDSSGKVVIKPQFDYAREFSEGLALVQYGLKWVAADGGVNEMPMGGISTKRMGIGGKYAFIDRTGKIVIDANAEFDLSEAHFSEGLAKVSAYVRGKGSRYGYINSSGKVVIKPQFNSAFEFQEGLAAVIVDGKGGYIDKTGKFVIPPKFRVNHPFQEGLGIVGFNFDEIGFINQAGEIVIQPQYGYMAGTGFKEGLSVVAFAYGKYGYIDQQGTLVIEMKFEEASAFSEGLASVKMDGKYGYIDKEGKFVIAPQFELASNFSEGLAVVSTDQEAGYIDKTGKMVIEPQFGNAFPFNGGLARVMTYAGGALIGTGYIDRTGKYVWKPTR